MLSEAMLSLVVAVCSTLPLPAFPQPSVPDMNLGTMHDVSIPTSFEQSQDAEPSADDHPEIPDDYRYAVQPNGDIPKAWTQKKRIVDDTHIDAWNQGNVDGHPASDAWFEAEPEYVADMLRRAISYDSDTDWFATVDTDLCRATFFHRENGQWVAKCGWNSYQGVHRPWQDSNYDGAESETKRNWKGPRSRSFKGAWKISGRWPDGGGVSEWATSIVACEHEKGAIGQDNCQRFEVGYGDAKNTPLEKRFKTHGCTGLDYENAVWICETIPNSTTVIVFDKVNPWPSWFQGDRSES